MVERLTMRNNEILSELQENGWKVIREHKHYILNHSESIKNLVVPKTPSDRRAIANIRKQALRLIHENKKKENM